MEGAAGEDHAVARAVRELQTFLRAKEKHRVIAGHATGTSMDSEDTLEFTSLTGVQPRIETMPLERAGEAYDRMMAGDARFRMVLTTS